MYPLLKVKANSDMLLRTNGLNSVSGRDALTDIDGKLLTDESASCYASVQDRSGNTTFERTKMSYVEPVGGTLQYWEYSVPAHIWPTQLGPWQVAVEVFGPEGPTNPTDDPMRTFFALAVEHDD